MVVIKFKNGEFEVQTTDKLEFKTNTLTENEVESIFIAKNKSDIDAFIQVNS